MAIRPMQGVGQSPVSAWLPLCTASATGPCEDGVSLEMALARALFQKQLADYLGS